MMLSLLQRFLILIVGFLLLCAQGKAEEDPNFQSTVEVGVVAVDEDVFISARVEQRIAVGGFSMALCGPFRVRMVDRPPSDNGALRKQDWDEPSDFAKIVPKLTFTRWFEEGFVDIYAGALNGVTIGMGAGAAYYFNSIDMDRYRGGLLLKGDFKGNGAEMLLDNFVAPSVIVGRVYVVPVAWFIEDEWARRLELSYTLGLDFRAPLRAYDNGTRIIAVTGGEISFRVVDSDRFQLKPSVGFMAEDGDLGIHVGVTTRWIILPSKKLGLSLHGEYRYVGSDYHPAIFNPFYDFNRFHYTLPDSPPDSTLADQLSFGESQQPSHGFMVDTAFEWQDKLQLGGRYDSEGESRSHWVMFYAAITPLKGYRLSGFFAGQDLTGSGAGLFSRHSIFGVEARGKIWGPIDLFFYFTRRWRDIPHTNSPADEFGAGVGVSLSY